jgi:tetratricopeptide (TPR) repeat protein
MTSRALAALALGGSLFIILSGYLQTLEASQFQTVSPEIIERYQQTLATDQDNLTLHYLLGVALLQDNQNEAALAKLQTAYPAYQQSIEAHYNLAIAALRLGDLVSAEIYLEQAMPTGRFANGTLRSPYQPGR